jgi:hypothetical protein
MTLPTVTLPDRLRVVPWPDPTLERFGHLPGSPYVEACWVSVLGPSASWAWQRLARLAATHPGSAVEVAELSASIGLGAPHGHNATINRTLGRLVTFGAAAPGPDGTLAVRSALPDLAARHLARAPQSVRAAHHALTGRPLPPPGRAPLAPDPAADPIPAPVISA